MPRSIGVDSKERDGRSERKETRPFSLFILFSLFSFFFPLSLSLLLTNIFLLPSSVPFHNLHFCKKRHTHPSSLNTPFGLRLWYLFWLYFSLSIFLLSFFFRVLFFRFLSRDVFLALSFSFSPLVLILSLLFLPLAFSLVLYLVLFLFRLFVLLLVFFFLLFFFPDTLTIRTGINVGGEEVKIGGGKAVEEEPDGRKQIQNAMYEAQQKNLVLLQSYPTFFSFSLHFPFPFFSHSLSPSSPFPLSSFSFFPLSFLVILFH